MKELIVLTALPGSGKSTWAKRYQTEHENTYIISSDEIRKELTGTYLDFSKQAEVWELFSKRIHEYALLNENVTVILDSLCDLNKLRVKYVKENPEFDKYRLIWIKKDPSKIKKYNKQRIEDKWVPDDVLESLINKFESPDEETCSCFDDFKIINYYF